MEATCQRCAHTHTHAGDCGHTHDQQGTGFLILSFLLLVGGVILRYLQLPFWMIPGVEVLWFLLAFLPVGFPVMVEVWKSIRQKDIFNEFSLMLLATIGAFCIGEYPEGVAVMLFYSVGERVQHRAVDRARRNIRRLLDVRPEKALVLRQGKEQSVFPGEVEVGEMIMVKPGERIPLDGLLQEEYALFDTSALTGESLPRTINRGEEVLAGMIVSGQAIRLKVTKPYEQSALARILALVQDASELKTLIAENSSLNGTLLVLSGAITLAFALFAALPAARSAARVSPIMAMSGTNLKIRRRKRKTKKIHNFEAYYARLNLKRNKGRTAITILSLVMSITVFIALQGFSSLLNAASALQDNHVGDYQITNESIGFTTDDLNTLRKNEAVQSVAAIQFSLYEQNENGLLDEISLEFQLKPGETFQVVGLNDEYWDYFMGDQLPEEQLGQLKSGNACIVRNPIPMSYGEDVLEFTNIEAGENICVAGMELNVLKTLDGYDGYLGIGNGGFTNGVQVIVDDAIYERLTGKDTYSEFLPTLNEGADRENFDTFIEAFCNRIPGTTFLSYEETDQQLKESFAQIQMLAWGLILFVGLIGILNIINTVYTNIHTRVTEIGMQRAIGMSADSLYKTFLWEGAYYGIIASVIGSVLGYVCTIFIEAATSDTIQLVAIPVMPILEATLLAVGACLLATAIPLRKISKMSIVDSIETVE